MQATTSSSTYQHADKVLDFSLDLGTSQTLVDDGDEPVKQAGVDVFSDRVLDSIGLLGVQARDNLVRARDDLLFNDPLFELRLVDSEQLRSELQALVFVVKQRVRSRRLDVHIADVQ